MTAAIELSAAMPCSGVISTSPLPRVRMIRQPPRNVPIEIASAHETFTQNGTAPVSVPPPRRQQRKGDHAHGLLGVVRAVRQRHQRCGADLAPTEAAVAVAHGDTRAHPVDQPRADGGDDQRDHRRDHRREQHLADHAVELGSVTDPVDPGEPEGGDGGADQATEQRVRGAGRQTQQPGRAGSRGCHPRGRRARSSAAPPRRRRGALGSGAPLESWTFTTALVTVRATSTLRNAPIRLRVPDRSTAAWGLSASGGDARGHRVGGVVEPVGEVEGQCGHHDQPENQEVWRHGLDHPAPRPIWRRVPRREHVAKHDGSCA